MSTIGTPTVSYHKATVNKTCVKLSGARTKLFVVSDSNNSLLGVIGFYSGFTQNSIKRLPSGNLLHYSLIHDIIRFIKLMLQNRPSNRFE